MKIKLNTQQYNIIFQILNQGKSEPAIMLATENVVSKIQTQVKQGAVGEVVPESIEIDLPTSEIYAIFEVLKSMTENKINVNDLNILRFAAIAVKCSKKYNEYLDTIKPIEVAKEFDLDAEDLD